MKTLPSPAEFFGFTPGDDRRLASWAQLTSYLDTISRDSLRVKKFGMGESTEGRPFYYLAISSPDNLSRIEEHREIQGKLADPRRTPPDEARELVARGKVVVLVTCSIHATEVGAAQMVPALVHEFATGEEPEIGEVLEHVIFLLVPSLNPDGLDLVVDWYRQTLNTPYEGVMPPVLYHKYAGHDNNRDWFMLNLVETGLVVEKIHNVWHPQIVLDLHQMGSDGFRMFLPPYVDPYDPNVDYILRQEINALGTHIMTELLSRGKAGVSCHNGFDAYTPARAYQHYHGGVRILSELASVKIATPVVIPRDQLRPAVDGQDPREATWNHPLPWQGGQWRLRDILDYEIVAVKACLLHAARWKELWLWNFYEHTRRWLERDEPPFAYVLPLEQKDPGALVELVQVLQRGLVEVEKAVEPFSVDGTTYPAGTLVVNLRQPYGRYAKTLLEIQRYPDLRRYAGGPPRPPYDVTGHTLPMAMGVRCFEVNSPLKVRTVLVSSESLPEDLGAKSPHPSGDGRCSHTEDDALKGGPLWLALSPSENASYRIVNLLLARGAPVWRALSRVWEGETIASPAQRTFPGGTFFVPAEHGENMFDRGSKDQLACGEGSPYEAGPACRLAVRRAGRVCELPAGKCRRMGLPRVAAYRSDRPVTGEGWLRLVLDRYGFQYSPVSNGEIRQGGLQKEFDVLIVPSQPADFIRKGNARGTMPPEYTGGWEEAGKLSVLEFVQSGGTLVMLDRACQWAVEELGVPVRDAVAGLPADRFFCPGSILRVIVDTDHPLGLGLPVETAIMFARSAAWEVSGPGASTVKVVARYPQANPLLSGWLLGEEFLRGKAALVEYVLGDGRIVLMGFEPHFRGQFTSTFKFLFNAILAGAMKEG